MFGEFAPLIKAYAEKIIVSYDLSRLCGAVILASECMNSIAEFVFTLGLDEAAITAIQHELGQFLLALYLGNKKPDDFVRSLSKTLSLPMDDQQKSKILDALKPHMIDKSRFECAEINMLRIYAGACSLVLAEELDQLFLELGKFLKKPTQQPDEEDVALQLAQTLSQCLLTFLPVVHERIERSMPQPDSIKATGSKVKGQLRRVKKDLTAFNDLKAQYEEYCSVKSLVSNIRESAIMLRKLNAPLAVASTPAIIKDPAVNCRAVVPYRATVACVPSMFFSQMVEQRIAPLTAALTAKGLRWG